MNTEPTSDIIAAYDGKAAALAARYEVALAIDVHRAVIEMLPTGPDRIALDVGAGSGRDAAWLTSLGFDTVAVEPSAGMRREAQRLHADIAVRWLDDRLPELGTLHRLGLSFDLILVSAVWQHVREGERPRAFRKLVSLLKPGGLLVISLREGPIDASRIMWPVSVGEIEALARTHGVAVQKTAASDDQLGRDDVRWTTVCLRLPDDGAGALPLIRGIILNDEKSATYKLGLLRAVARIADTTPALAVPSPSEDSVSLPLGLVALVWVRMYLPLVSAGFPQMPTNSGPDGLGFAKSGFRALMDMGINHQDLRVGAAFSAERAVAVAQALGEAARTITEMPANFTRLPNSNVPVFATERNRAPRPSSRLMLDAETLTAYGVLSVPGHIWRAMGRLGAWIEPVLVAEWSRLVRLYAERQGRGLPLGLVEKALTWLEPDRDTVFVRTRAAEMIAQGRQVGCVWSGRSIQKGMLDIDHCLPWSAWPCSDLWNLMPADPRINQHQKRDRLPSAVALAGAKENILTWWECAWVHDGILHERFEREAQAALPAVFGKSLDAIFAALEWRRLRLRQDQQVREWEGVATVTAR